MFGAFGFSYIGLIFLLMLFIPNIIWLKQKTQGYTAKKESRILTFFERLGEILTCCCSLIFSDFNIQKWSAWSLFLIISFLLMAIYEIWWIRYFRSERQMKDFYSDFLCIPLAGATLPVIAFFILGIYGKNIVMLISSALLGIGHIGIHLQHKKKLMK